MSRSSALGLGALLALGIAAWLVLDVLSPHADSGVSTGGTSEQRDVALIAGVVDGTDDVLDASAAPTLESQRRTRGPVRVRVVDPWGRPFADRLVQLRAPGRWTLQIEAERRTDARGCVNFTDVPYDETRTVAVFFETAQGADPLVTAPVKRRAVTIEIDALPLLVHAETSDSGRALRGVSYRASPQLGRPSPFTGDVAEDFLAMGPNRSGEIDVALEAPSGYVAWDGCKHKIVTAPTARALRYHAPLRPEADVYVTLPEARRDWQFQVTVHGRAVPNAEAGSDAFGRTRLRGIPFVPGAAVVVVAKAPALTATATARFGFDARDTLGLALRSPKPPKTPKPASPSANTAQQLATLLASGTWRQHLVVARGDAPYGRVHFRIADSSGSVQTLRPPLVLDFFQTRAAGEKPPPKGRRVELRIQNADGHPVAGAQVVLASQMRRTDALGKAVFVEIPAASQRVTVTGAGPAWSEKLAISAGSYQTHHIRVPRAGTVALKVVGKDGRPCPHARLTVSQSSNLPWYDLEDDVQRLDPFTDAIGTRRLRNLQPDTDITIQVSYAGESRKAVVRLSAGEQKTLVVDMSKPQALVVTMGSDTPLRTTTNYTVFLSDTQGNVWEIEPK